MTERTKELFESLTLLRYAAEHKTNDISFDDIQNSYYKLFDILSQLKYVEDQDEFAIKTKKEQDEKIAMIHKKVIENFNNMGAIEIAKDITDKMANLGINNNYIISEMSDGTIGIIDSKSDPNNKQILRYYTDIYDYQINVIDDLKCNFKRTKLFETLPKLSKNKSDNVE